MRDIVYSLLALTPLVVSLIAAATAWRSVRQPMLFLLSSVFICLGIQALAAPIAISWLLARGGMQPYIAQTTFAGAVAVLVFGLPLLWWLFAALRHE